MQFADVEQSENAIETAWNLAHPADGKPPGSPGQTRRDTWAAFSGLGVTPLDEHALHFPDADVKERLMPARSKVESWCSTRLGAGRLTVGLQ